MRSVKILVVLLAFGATAFLVTRYFLPQGGPDVPARPAPAPPTGLDPGLRARLEAAPDLDAPAEFRLAMDEHRGRPAEVELRTLFAARAEVVRSLLEAEVEELLSSCRYRSAAALLDRYGAKWRLTAVEETVAGMRAAMREEQAAQVEGRGEEADALVEAGRFEAAREALQTGWELEEPYAAVLQELRDRTERRIRARSATPMARPVAPESAPAPVVLAEPSAPPPLPGFPHPDVKRLREARDLYGKAMQLFQQSKHQRAADAVRDLLGYYGDLAFVRRRREAVDAMGLLARHGTSGVTGLFHAAAVKRDGKRIRLQYLFETPEEHLDWEAMPTIPHEKDGKFEPARGGVRGLGTTTYLLRAFFANDVRIRCVSRPQEIRSHGVAFCQHGLETRQIDLLVTNHWFTEGENYVKQRPGHSLLMIGKGVNADVPVDAPEVGFVFRGPSTTKPDPPAGAELGLSFELQGNRMTGDVSWKLETGTLREDAVGDDGRTIERLRPSLFVVDAAVLFREVVVEGVLHPDFEKTRVSELLAAASR